MNAFRGLTLGLVLVGGFLAAPLFAQQPTTQYRSFSYEPAAVTAPARSYSRVIHHHYRPAYMTQKSLR